MIQTNPKLQFRPFLVREKERVWGWVSVKNWGGDKLSEYIIQKKISTKKIQKIDCLFKTKNI